MHTTELPHAFPPNIKEAQPKGLYLLFFTELWERFGFYTLQTIIILYMTKALLMQDAEANLLYAAFSALLYLTPTIGGYLADRHLGFQRAISIGGILFISAYLLCALSNERFFFLGLGLLIVANGFFKPTVSSIVGELYKENDARREGGFTIFYMGINVGALIPPLIAGGLVAKYGWHAGFLLAAFGMLLGQLTFQFGRKRLGEAGLHPKYQTKTKLGFLFYSLLCLGIVVCVGLCQIAFHYPKMTAYLIEIAGVVIVVIVLLQLLKLPLKERKKMFAALLLIIISIAFWSLYNQAFTSLMLFADRNMEKQFLGMPFTAEATQFFNPFFIIALSPLLSRLWIKMDKHTLNPSIQLKFFFGVFFMSAGFFLLAFGATYFSHLGMTAPGWLGASYLLQTMGELLISPIGLAMITVLCPKKMVGMMMGVWFFAQAMSFTIGGFLANIAAVPQTLSVEASLAIYSHAFTTYGIIALVMSVFSLALLPLIYKMTRE